MRSSSRSDWVSHEWSIRQVMTGLDLRNDSSLNYLSLRRAHGSESTCKKRDEKFITADGDLHNRSQCWWLLSHNCRRQTGWSVQVKLVGKWLHMSIRAAARWGSHSKNHQFPELTRGILKCALMTSASSSLYSKKLAFNFHVSLLI